MNDKTKTVFSYIGIVMLSFVLLFSTYGKYIRGYSERKHNKDNIKIVDASIRKESKLRELKNIEPIKANNFKLDNIDLDFDDDNETLLLTGTLTNLNEKEKSFKIISKLYDKRKNIICEKQIDYEIILEPKKIVDIVINHYYDEIKSDEDNIKYYSINIVKK